MSGLIATGKCPLLDYFQSRQPALAKRANHIDWELLIRQARHANLLSRLALTLDDGGALAELDASAAQHLHNAIKVSQANARAARWEITNIYDLLHANAIPFVLLKGCAYLWTGNHASTGRLFGDTDILVKQNDLHRAEVLFTHNGWVTTKLANHDQKYYRNWMHELPPLHHTTRHTSLDVHHHILPPVVGTVFEIDAFWSQAIEDPGHPGLFTLSPIDMILHSATHLFQEGEFEQGFRDLVDLDSLITEFITEDRHWQTLQTRAAELDLGRFTCYALECCRRILGTQVPGPVLENLKQTAGPGKFEARLMSDLLCTAIIPDHASMRPRGSKLARGFLLLRSHWIKMPWYLLIWHFYQKSITNLWFRRKSSKRHFSALGSAR